MYQVAKYYALTPMRPNEVVFVFSSEVWDTYSKEAQDLIYATAQYVLREYEYAYFKQVEASSFATLEENDVNIFTPDAAFVNELRDLTAGVAEDFKKKDADCAAIYDEFVAKIAADNAAH
jgi:TRAP-type C4-dicarboxylate transport system substrate-binding protein